MEKYVYPVAILGVYAASMLGADPYSRENGQLLDMISKYDKMLQVHESNYERVSDLGSLKENLMGSLKLHHYMDKYVDQNENNLLRAYGGYAMARIGYTMQEFKDNYLGERVLFVYAQYDKTERSSAFAVKNVDSISDKEEELMPLYQRIVSESYILGLKSVHAQKDKLKKRYEHPKNPYSEAEYLQKQSELDVRLTKFMSGFYQHELVTPKYEEEFTQLVHKYGYEHRIPAVYNKSNAERPQYVAFYLPKQQRAAYSAPQVTQYNTKQFSPAAYARAENVAKYNLGANAKHTHVIPSFETEGNLVMTPLHAQTSPGYDSAMRHAFNYGMMMPKGTKALAYLKESNKMAQEASDMVHASKKYLTYAKKPEYEVPRISVRPAQIASDGQIASYKQPLAVYNNQIQLPQKAVYALNPRGQAYNVPSRGVYLPTTTSYTPTGETLTYVPSSR